MKSARTAVAILVVLAVLGTAAASRLAPAAPAPGPTGKPTSGNATAIAKQKQPSGTTPSTGASTKGPAIPFGTKGAPTSGPKAPPKAAPKAAAPKGTASGNGTKSGPEAPPKDAKPSNGTDASADDGGDDGLGDLGIAEGVDIGEDDLVADEVKGWPGWIPCCKTQKPGARRRFLLGA